MKFTKIFILLALVSTHLILSINLFTFYWADDYGLINDLNKTNIIDFLVIGYFDWDGRFLTIAGFAQSILLKYTQIEWITFTWNVFFLASSFLIFPIISKKIQLNLSKNKFLFYTLFFGLFFWLSSYSFLAQTVYWGTGGAYSLNLFIGSVWLYFYFSLTNQNDIKNKNAILFYVFSFFAGATTQNLSIPLIVITIFTLIYSKKIKFNALSIFFLLLGIVFLLIAPGNFVRMQHIPQSGLNSFNNLIKNIFDVYYIFSKRSLFLIVLLICSIIFSYIKLKKSTIKIENFIFLIACLSSALPFFIIPIASERTTIYFCYFLLLFIGNLFFINPEAIKNVFSQIKFKALMILFLFILNIFIVYNLKNGYQLKKEIVKRELILSKNKFKKVVYINEINPKLKTYCFNFYDLIVGSEGNNHFINNSVEDNYNIEKITIIPYKKD